MTDFDKKVQALLESSEDHLVSDAIDENGYYQSAFASLKGKGSGMRVMSWIGILIFSALLLLCIWQFFQATTTRDQILFASLAVMLNSAQIALKMWFNMQLNRGAIIGEMQRLQLALLRDARR
ncbi:MAG: DUF6768 family protein [Gammaproteobacteria bacterium]